MIAADGHSARMADYADRSRTGGSDPQPTDANLTARLLATGMTASTVRRLIETRGHPGVECWIRHHLAEAECPWGDAA